MGVCGREPLEMVTASLMQNMEQIRKKNTYLVTKLFLKVFGKSSVGALGVESPHGGAIYVGGQLLHPCRVSMLLLAD